MNAIMAMLRVPLTNDSDPPDLPDLAIWPMPFIDPGAVLLLQVVIISVLTSPTGIQAWDASQFDLTAAAIVDPYIIAYHHGCCMISVRKRHAQPRTAIAMDLTSKCPKGRLTNPTLYKNLSWSFFSNSATFTHTFNIGISIIHVLLTFIVVIVARSTLTMGLHGCEIITNIVRDEKFFYLALMGDIYRYHGAPRLPLSLWLAARGDGHLQTLAGLIDYWPSRHGRILWGDKPTPTPPYNGVYYAGTSRETLAPVKMGFSYAGEDGLI
ncbi:hypothetical protein FIBSPDRAFT_1052067 [Athelia psychrophila]|uniref:Uncharacterized protein n=1 Tax=Athelia psychrophila TaxID=1759441 RepID=A0A165XWM3_9AGAM|nr:hypothetical protein FIBSPDRAFT_1052067 [Fibularhizoctonia sp. CBS 109695]